MLQTDHLKQLVCIRSVFYNALYKRDIFIRRKARKQIVELEDKSDHIRAVCAHLLVIHRRHLIPCNLYRSLRRLIHTAKHI